MRKRTRVGLLGLGTVGSGVFRLLQENRQAIASKTGVDLEVSKILVRDGRKKRHGISPGLLTTRPTEVLDNGCDIIVELLGGIDPASSFIRRAIEARRHVVTANKMLLATRGAFLFDEAKKKGVTIGFEASVCGAVPIVRALRSGLAGDSVASIRGILNGTCNFILSAMEEGLEFEEALCSAQRLGFAEADPSLDIDGEDAAQKIQILSDLVFPDTSTRTVRIEGIRGVSRNAVVRAKRDGGRLRLVASAGLTNGVLEIRVGPVLLSHADRLASVVGENNAVVVQSSAAGELFFHGLGAGALPTASAVLSDIVEVARTIR